MNSKPILIWGTLLANALLFLASLQVWVIGTLTPSAAAETQLAVTGQEARPALLPIAIAGVIAALLLAISGKLMRRVLGVLGALFGAGVTLIGLSGLNGRDALARKVAELTGIIGEGQYEVLANAHVTVWPTISMVSGVALLVLGIATAWFSGSWKTASRRYEREQTGDLTDRASARDDADQDRVSEWDAQAKGIDPSV